MDAAPRRVRSGDADIAWYESGDPSAEAVLLLHSIGLDARVWDPQVPVLAAEHHVVAIDLRGHGRSDAPVGRYTMAQLAADVLAVADAAGIDRFHVLGLSIGGQVALRLALDEPGRIASQVVADSAARIGSRESWEARIELVGREGLGAVAERSLGIWFRPDFVGRDRARVAWARERLLSTDPLGYAGCCAALADSDLRDAVAGIVAPTLVIVGSEDASTTPEEARWLASTIPGARLVVIEEAAHISNIEAATAFNQAILGFLADQTRP